MSGLGTTDGPVLACGEVRTCLLPTRDAVDERAAEQLLRLRADERVRLSRRPNRHAVSPDVLTGVDCRLPTATGTRIRAVGTVTARAGLVEGRVLQSTAYFSAPADGPDRRQPWGYYLVRPGCLVPVGRLAEKSVTEGFLAGHQQGDLDVGSIAESLLARISRRHQLLDYDTPLTTADTSLRWTASPAGDGEEASLHFTEAGDGLRIVELRLPRGTEPAAAAELCEDLALHDWLLTTVADKLDGLRLGSADGTAALKVLRPLVDHLLHLWMPQARVDRALHSPWEELEKYPGFSRQWNTLAQRIRDQLAVQNLTRREALTTP
ncbi:SCO2521 family protein [Streptomyces sp. NBC_01275]|uniref:SCO2521 family protein n=1 Tax=Streptomyces sp. NBC_01275 TaxID=2903807 RepID=UPI002250882F|nr:SCO2521 family protein [Streptomyces sp. NBC_01275]MCX4762033.1 SCO2521 family protein [Streptomyces sp. NBC_01275]